MRLEVEYRANEGRWNWRVYSDGSVQPENVVVRAGQARGHDEAIEQAHAAADEYKTREQYAA